MDEDSEASQFPPARVAGRGPGWYRGDCHVHSVVSNGGELTPQRLAAGARSAGLDFVAATEHNTADSHGAWRQHAGDDLLVILGQEVVTQTGHWLALGVRPGQVVDWRYGVRDNMIGGQLAEVRRVGGLCVAAHPYAPYDSGTFLYPYQGFDVVEVWNGQWSSDLLWQADNEAALVHWGRSLAADVCHGRWRPAIGNSDTHLENQIGTPHTVVLANELSVAAILAGIRAGRSWIAASNAIDLSLTVSADGYTAGLGERLTAGNEPAVLRLEVRGVPSGEVSLHTDNGHVYAAALPATGPGTVEWQIDPSAAFIRAEIRAANGHMAAMSNPIILV